VENQRASAISRGLPRSNRGALEFRKAILSAAQKCRNIGAVRSGGHLFPRIRLLKRVRTSMKCRNPITALNRTFNLSILNTNTTTFFYHPRRGNICLATGQQSLFDTKLAKSL
jgi:hypothetical protein